MVDPLNPFTSLVRTLATKRSDKAQRAEKSNPTQPKKLHDDKKAEPPDRTAVLKARLRSKLGAIDVENSATARTAFVETVLLWQFGDEIGSDPGFPEMVATVADQIGGDESLDSELGSLMRSLRA